MSFAQFNFNDAIASGIAECGFISPTPIQQQAIPAILDGRDVMGLAQTGTGKTAAFVLPALERLMRGGRRQLRMLVLTPTRELAEQIHTVVSEFQGRTRLSSTAVYGGVSVSKQEQRLRRGVDVVVACPGRLLDHIRRGTIDLSKVEISVLDEADQMFDRGFFPDVKRIIAELPRIRQNLMFSATMPAAVRGLAREMLVDPVTVEAAYTQPVATIAHALYPVPSRQKHALLVELLSQIKKESVLVFTRTKHRAKRLAQQLEDEGVSTASLQGNLSQNRRQEALMQFRTGKVQVLVATDIAARGLDIDSISHVINFDIPDTADAYVHRIGRTGRAARSGEAFTFVTPDDEAMVKEIERRLGKRLERVLLADFIYEGPAEHSKSPVMKPSTGRARPVFRRRNSLRATRRVRRQG